MIPITYNKPASRQGSSIHGQVIAPVRDAACTDMNWHKYFEYDESTGNLIRICVAHKDGSTSPCERIVAGTKQFHRGGRVAHCIRIRILGMSCVAHRIVWEMNRGSIPSGMVIDHINGNPFDNRLSNLRLASPAQNARNSRVRIDNKFGLKGVRPLPGGNWQARISVDGRLLSLGVSETKEGAYLIYAEAAKRYHGEFART